MVDLVKLYNMCEERKRVETIISLLPLDSMRLVRGVLNDFGVSQTRDLTPFRDLCLNETLNEFVQHHEQMKNEQSAKRTLLCSSCPGFVCYAEKTHGDLLVPKLSKVRSPQQIRAVFNSLFYWWNDKDFWLVDIKKLKPLWAAFHWKRNSQMSIMLVLCPALTRS